MFHRPSKQTYLDGAIHHNNPIQIADKERKLIWPNISNEVPDVIVSIGSTYFPTSRNGDGKPSAPRLGVLSHGKQIYKIAHHSIASTMNSEKTWEDYISILQPSPINRLRYVRLNPQLDEEPPRSDDVHRMEDIQRLVRKTWQDNQEIRRVSRQLIASSFYFEKSTDLELTADQIFRCKGYFSLPRLAGNAFLMKKRRSYTLSAIRGNRRNQRAGKIPSKKHRGRA